MPRCPACSEMLFRRRVENVEVDGCPGCGGVWLDKGELHALAKAPGALRNINRTFVPAVQTGVMPERSESCPRCSEPLKPFEFDQFRGVRLDRCKTCGGMWLDHGEAGAIADRLDPPVPAAVEAPAVEASAIEAPVAVSAAVAARFGQGPTSQGPDSSGLELDLDRAPAAFRSDTAAAWVPAPMVASTVAVHQDRGHAAWPGFFWDEVHRSDHLTVQQQFEIGEFFGFETRNKYAIWSENRSIGWAAEQGKDLLGFLFRQVLGHWRSFEIFIFDEQRQPVLRAYHPFRFLFQRLEVSLADGTYLGALQQRFSILSKRFDVLGPDGGVLMTVDSPIWKLWTFPFKRGAEEVGSVMKRWSGLFSEAFSDRDNFTVKLGPSLNDAERALLLAAALFIDLQYFEHKPR